MTLNLLQMASIAESAENDLLYGGIFGPNLGIREDMPNINLAEAFSPANENVLLRYGEIQRSRMRLPEFNQTEFTTGTLTATNGNTTVTASAGAGTWSTSATHKPSWVGRVITITDGGSDYEYTIAAINDAGTEITLSDNYEGTGGAGLTYAIGSAGTQVQAPDTNTIIHWHRLVRNEGGSQVEYMFAYTKAHVYLWSTAWSAWILKLTCGSDCEMWDTESFKEQVVSTNNVDKVQVWGATTANAFGNLTGDADGVLTSTGNYLTKAKFICEYENRILLGFVTIQSTVYPEKNNYCSQDDETNFNVDGAGDAGAFNVRHNIKGGENSINGYGKYKNWLIIGKQSSMHRYWLVRGAVVFSGDVILPKIGVRAAHTMINDKEGNLYWLANDYTIQELTRGNVSQVRDKTLKQINPTYEHLAEATFVDTYGHFLFSIPHGPEATENNLLLWYEPQVGRWGNIDMAVAAFGDYHRQAAFTIDTIPYPTVDKIGWKTIDDVENMAGFSLALCSDYSGYGYAMQAAETDNGADYSGHFTLSTDMLERIFAKRYGTSIREYKGLKYLQIWVRSEASGTLEVSAKRDNENDFQSIKSISLVNATNKIFGYEIGMDECDLRARVFELKFAGSNRFRVLGCIFGFMRDGFN